MNYPGKLLGTAIVVLWLAAPAKAQKIVALQYIHEESFPFIAEFVAPGASEMALSESMRLVAVTHKGEQAARVSIYTLDETGAPAATEPMALELPRRGPLAAHTTYALGVTFHPTLPLLYVWQDVNAPQDQAETFEHLLIFRVAHGKAELVQACGKGSDYAAGRKVGYIAFDDRATRLYFPNLTRMEKGKPVNGIGYFRIGKNGLVLPEDGTAEAGFMAQSEVAFSLYIPHDNAGGFVPVSDEVIIFAGAAGPISWDQVEARQRFSYVGVWPPARPYRRIAAHPTLSVIYMSLLGTGYVLQLKHAEGYITSNFQATTITGPTSRPVVLGNRKMVAFGAKNQIQFISIDDRGYFLPEFRRAVVSSDDVSALSYSEKFDKFYVAVEKGK